MIRAAIFDFDGTLVNTFRYHTLSYMYAFKTFGKNVKYKEMTRLFGKSAECIIRHFFRNLSKSKMLEIKAVKDKKYCDEYLTKIKLLPKVEETLKWLKRRKIKLGLISLTPKKYLIKYAKTVGVKKYFSAIVGEDEVPNMLRENSLLKIEKKLKTKEIVYVGDSIFDAIAAKKAKVNFIGVATGSYSRADLKKHTKTVFLNMRGVKKFLDYLTKE